MRRSVISERVSVVGSSVPGVYPDSVLFHIRLRGVTEQGVEALAETPGFHCRVEDDDATLVSIRLAHDVPSPPDTKAMEKRLRLALHSLAPGAEIIDVRSGPRHSPEVPSLAVQSLHCLRRHLGRPIDVEEMDWDTLTELWTIMRREFLQLDEFLCNGGSLPADWARRHPQGDERAFEQVAASHAPVAMAS